MQSAIVQFPDTVHILIGKVSLLEFAHVRFQVFSVAKTRREIIDDVEKF